ncbi:MAG TPA: ATP-binding protein [Mycobacterium sp.]|nr:ATP-binding protein [Mycobacterium sp.]
MLTEILLLLLVLAVAALMVVDLTRTRSESSHGHADRPAYVPERATTVPSRAPAAGALSPELAESVTTVPAPDLRVSGTLEGIGPPPGSEPRPGTGSAHQDGSRIRRASSDVRSRILLLAIIPAVTAVVVTLCVVRIVTLLNGASIHSQISSIHDGAVISVAVTSVVLIVVLALGLWVTIKITGFVLRPWQRLQAGVLEAGGSSDKIGEPAGVFDQMRREISRMTANETQLRGKLSAMFVNLSHRSRSLAERQIRLIDNLERGELDEQRLADLAKVNRIAAHLYRNSENLLILAGHEPSTGSNQSATLTYLVRAAASEIEEGERVSFDVQPDIAVRGPATADVLHLLAELIQNATSFSAADMPVHVTGHSLATGGVLVDITDGGIGMTAKEMAYANWQLENPPATDIDVPRWMGLLVVARLAARHRIRVRLNQAESGGLTAYVWLPDEIITHRDDAASPMMSDLSRVGAAAGSPAAATADRGYATAQRTSTAGRSAEFASAGGNPPDAMADLRSPSWAEQPATAPTEPPATVRTNESTALQAGQTGTPQSEQLVTLQAEQFSTLGSSGSGQPDTTAEDAGVSGPPSLAFGHETPPVEVIVPPANDVVRTVGLPIYDEVESRWFRSGRQAFSSSGPVVPGENGWSSPADEGWQAAQTVGSPASAGSTAAGLPRRLPNANLLPGSIGSQPSAAPPRSAAAARDRLAGLQRGVSEGRAAAMETVDQGGNEDT